MDAKMDSSSVPVDDEMRRKDATTEAVVPSSNAVAANHNLSDMRVEDMPLSSLEDDNMLQPRESMLLHAFKDENTPHMLDSPQGGILCTNDRQKEVLDDTQSGQIHTAVELLTLEDRAPIAAVERDELVCVIPKLLQQPQQPKKTESNLSANSGSTSDYQYSSARSVLDKNTNNYTYAISEFRRSSPTRSLALRPSNIQQTRPPLIVEFISRHHQYRQYSPSAIFPQSITGLSRGDVLYDPGVFFPNGKFSNLPVENELSELGSGTNGKVFKSFISGFEVAYKYTNYRKKENEIWSTLQHENILPLVAVMVDIVPDKGKSTCCQMMPLMTSTLHHELKCLEGGDIIRKLDKDASFEAVIWCNLWFILSCILKALSYLSQNMIQLQDLKDKNVLIYRTCHCDSAYLCQCSDQQYTVQISDFDSIRTPSYESQFDAGVRKRKSSDECEKVLGTPGYRAPEQFMTTGINDITGPWCDVWSFGVLVCKQFLKTETDYIIGQANLLCGESCKSNLNRRNPQPELITPLYLVIKLFSSKFELAVKTAKLIHGCFDSDYCNRSTPDQLLAELEKLHPKSLYSEIVT